MKPLLLLLQSTNINEKINNAPDSGYQIGVFIGTFLPFAVLAGIAYWMYYRAKKRENKP
ncbi:hypothetical protein FLJC2902T_10740 [Flavobacterium limnosediminis JC2902]|uniref:Uncharacterized protein n=1 Tax=Flavobacterium limnosediminis JC2902 TaxID=1341181 RepID=V6SRF2_9FLAO|nr:hypothetical protein [Flavobacterium limnosediminis]ESU29039.1 hypothetical protein FLJC2902T_10740 [Flavobacterium limnosediminis JC2902]